MTHYSFLRLKSFPEIDEKKMLRLNSGEYFLKDQIFFIHQNRDKLKDYSITGPSITTTLTATVTDFKLKGPIIDINEKSPKINFAPIDEVKTFYLFSSADIIKAFFLHFSFIFSYFLLILISNFKHQEPQIIEITFGLTDQVTKTQQEIIEKQPEGQTEATKTIKDLAQLPKNVSPNVAPESSPENEMSDSNKDNNLVFKEKNKVETSTKKEKQEEKPKKIGQKIDNIKREIEEKDYLKRKEEDLRKIATEKKQGVHEKNPLKPEGQKHTSLDLPKSPFQTSDDVPQAPPGLAPTGSENGININNYNAYRVYLQKQLRFNWNLNEGSSYPKDLKTIVEFTVNPFGYLLGKAKVHKSSGNKAFDDLAIKAVEETFPVSSPPPKSIRPPQTFKATYSARNVD